MSELIKKVESKDWNGQLMPNPGKENNEFGMDKYLHPAKTQGNNAYFVIRLSIKSTNFGDQTVTISKTLFQGSFMSNLLEEDIKNNKGQVINNEGTFVKNITGDYVELPYPYKCNVKFTDPRDNTKTLTSEGRTSEPTFLFAGESMETAITRLHNRIKKNKKRYIPVIENIDTNDAFNEAISQQEGE